MTLTQAEILPQVRQHFGSDCTIESFRQFKGGARKQVFFLTLSNPRTQCALYLWQNADNYFAERVAGGFEETQTDEMAPVLFQTNTHFLLEKGVNVPQILYTGILNSGHHFAFVEQIIGADFSTFAESAADSERQAVLTQIAAQMGKLHAISRSYPGVLQDEPTDPRPLPQDRTLSRALLEVDATAKVQPQVAPHRTRIRDKLQALRTQVSPRSIYHLIHGELVGNHVLVRNRDQTVYFVDIEGLHFTDLEAEHAFLQLVYPPADYQYLARAGLDPARMAFCKFAMHVSLVYAGSCFMLRGFHDQAWAEHLFKKNLSQVLESI